MPRGSCHRHGPKQPCTCAMGNLYRFIEPVVLFLLRKKGGSYGYELAKDLQAHALTDATIEKGALYRTLRALEENGYVVSNWETAGAGPARRHYRLTPSGIRHLDEWAEVLDNLAQAMKQFVGEIGVHNRHA
ncbi:PadR family transcriptional regulator [Geoalkalibacter halelectricus]|uniref:PadR family transcriptional regulator n=1 Tax=Geoalkalibacter halelectricus TaxID=2847045 RepID=UPI00266F2A66|nr:PadR family transcriptional regulator [Geoalkalibacter halelectricus]MDO3380329.1 PadR family transcriptional regulator [Geoalkalibacter halelectricus]